MSNPINEQIERLRAAVVLFQQTFGRVPTIAFDADGVIYDFETPYIAHHNRTNPHLPPIVGPFEKFDVGYNQTPEVAEALQESMRTLDWSELQPYPEAFAVLPVLLEVGLDLSIATAHRVDNTYSPAAKIYQFHHDFEGYFDDRIQIGIDKTRIVADFLIDDKPEVTGALPPMWEHIYFTQHYNRDLPGVHVVWETMFEVLASVIEATVAGRTLPPVPAPSLPTALPALTDEDDSDEPVLRRARVTAADAAAASGDVIPEWAEQEDLPTGPVDENSTTEALALALPWDIKVPEPSAQPSWDEIISGESKK